MAKRRALLIGVNEYDKHPDIQLKKSHQDVASLKSVLADSYIGAFDEIEALESPDSSEAADKIATLFDETNEGDLALFYFSGHGFRENKIGPLFLGMRNTRQSSKITGIQAKNIRELIDQPRVTRALIILDCCFSGEFMGDRKGGGQGVLVDEVWEAGGQGRVVLTATTAMLPAREGPPEIPESVFTHHLVQGLKRGADVDGLTVTAAQLYAYVKKAMQRGNAEHTPALWVSRQVGEPLVVARNPMHAGVEEIVRALRSCDDDVVYTERELRERVCRVVPVERFEVAFVWLKKQGEIHQVGNHVAFTKRGRSKYGT